MNCYQLLLTSSCDWLVTTANYSHQAQSALGRAMYLSQQAPSDATATSLFHKVFLEGTMHMN